MGVKVLFVTSYPLEYNSSANIRNWGLIEGLYANGVEIYTLSPYPTDFSMFNGELQNKFFVKRYWIGGKPNTPYQAKGIDSKVLSPFKAKAKKIVFDLFNYLSIYDRRRYLSKKIDANDIDERFDFIISSSDPKSAHLFAKRLYKQKPSIGKKWIQYWGDPFSNDISSKRLFGNFFVKRAEKGLLRLADKAVYVSPFTADSIINKYPMFKEKIAFLPIPYRLSDNNKQNESFEKGLVGYFGDYSSKNRNIVPFYEALKALHLNANIIGNSDIELSPTDSIHVSRRMPIEEIKHVTEKTQVFVCICNLQGTQIPGKVYHYVNSGKPIVIVLDGDNKKELQEYFESFDRFYICHNTKESISDCLSKSINENKSFRVPDALNPQLIARKIIEC